VTTTFPQQYPQLIELMRNEPLGFIGIDYAVDNRDVEETILPLAQERKIVVLVLHPSAAPACGTGSAAASCRAGRATSAPKLGLSSF
jgi:hypothetical protein